jgi:hypothetical protein
MFFFWLFFSIDAIFALIVFYFLGEGIVDRTVSSNNFASWLLLALTPVVVLTTGLNLKHKNKLLWAKLVVSLMAIPGIILSLFALYLGNQNWH